METEQGPAPRGRPPGHSGAREREARILELLGEHPEGMTRNAIADATGEAPQKVWLALDRLRDQGLVRTCAPVQVTEDVDGQPRSRGRQLTWSLGEECQ
jgi:DNA-binding transcriptional ArsR family regulator